MTCTQGYLNIPDIEPGGSKYYMTKADTSSPSMNYGSSDSPKNAFFITPNLCDGALTAPINGMNISIDGVMVNANTDASVGFGGDPYWMYKLYNHVNFTRSTGTLEQCDYISYAGNIIDSSTSTDVYNYDYGTNPSFTTSHSVGNPAYYIRTSMNIPWTFVASYPAGKLLATISRTLTSQYGGNTYSARANNVYISCSHYRPIRTSGAAIIDNFRCYGGDIFVNMYDSCRAAKNWEVSGRGTEANKYSATFYFPVESQVNTDLRNGFCMNKDFLSTGGFETGTEMKETYTYNSIYSAECTIKEFFPRPDPFILNEEFDNRFYASEIKINGELSDSWRVFKVNNYWDVEGTYGPINAMEILRDRMYFWQNRAFGIIQINPRAVITDVNATTNSQLQVGTGLPLQRHDYLSTEVGLQHQWGLTKSSYKLFWLDVNNRKFFTYAEGQSVSPESDVKGLLSFFKNNLNYNILSVDKPTYNDNSIGINGVVAVYDFKYNQAIFTIHDGREGTDVVEFQGVIPIVNAYTIAFDEKIDCFTSFYSFHPKVYMSDGYKIFSTDPDNLSDIYIHDSGDYSRFYGILYDEKIKMVVNDHPQYTKVFDNIMYDSQSYDSVLSINYRDDTWNNIRVYNDYQNSDFQRLRNTINIKRKERTWQLAIPRNRVLYTTSSPDIFTDLSLTDKVMGERMRDKYLIIDLEYNNGLSVNFAFNNLRTIYRQSAR